MLQAPNASRPPAAPARRLNGALMARRMHGYIGMLIAPSVLFFAATGAVQLFGLHEAHDAYRPPAALAALSALHKDQVLAVPKPKPRHAPEPSGRGQKPKAGADAGPKLSTWLLKGVFLAVALGLIASTCLGIWMAFQDRRRRTLNLVLLAVGVMTPVLLALI